MSYLRGRFYVYGDGERIHLWIRDKADDVRAQARGAVGQFVNGVAIPEKIFDMLALGHVARLKREGTLEETEARYAEWLGTSAQVEELATLSKTLAEADALASARVLTPPQP